ncbi:unnamed protein product [Rotaria sordida]|uniref:Uncharacterized protein n=1 Tax=Rotaria sordida TaxID=392033 RepID=A0A819HNB6_9BILA|nr:unnamed protein product [Rotaria sordida]
MRSWITSGNNLLNAHGIKQGMEHAGGNKRYNIELQDKLSPFINQLEETTNSNTLDLYEPENDDHDLTVVTEGKNNEVIHDESSISTPHLHPVIRQNAYKRKADQLIDPENTGEENAPSTKKTTRSTRRKRRCKL